MATVPMFDPSGQVRQIPAEQADAATQAGGKPAVKMLDPSGTPRWIPQDSQDAALAAGGRTAPPDAMNADGSPNTALPFYQQHSSAGYELNQLGQGAANSLSQVGHTAEGMIAHVPGIGHFLIDHTGFAKSMSDDAARASAPNDTPGKKAGSAIENILEFASGDEALKALTLPERIAKLGMMAKTLEKYPAIGRMVGGTAGKIAGAAAGQGTVATAQGLAHGQDAGTALEGGAVAGATGGALEGGGQALGKIVSKIAPGVRKLGNVEVPQLASQADDAGSLARASSDIATEPKYQAAAQAGAQQSTQDFAQQATRDSLGRVNSGRGGAVTDPAKMLPAPENMQPYKFQLRTTEPTEQVPQMSQEGTRDYASAGTQEVPNQGYQPGGAGGATDALGSTANATPERSFSGEPTRTVSNWQEQGPVPGDNPVVRGGGGTMTTSDPSLVQSHLSNVQELIDSPSFGKLSPLAQRRNLEYAADLRSQLDTHGAYQARMSHFSPIDAEGAASKVTNYSQAADQVEGGVKDVFGKLDEVSGNQFRDLRAREQNLRSSLRNGTTSDIEGAQAELTNTQARQAKIFEDNKTQINPAEWASARSAWSDASTLRDIHDAIEKSFQGPNAEVAARNPNLQRKLVGGNKLTNNLNKLLAERGDDVTRVIGKDGIDHLYQMSDLLKTPERAEATKGLIALMGRAARNRGHQIGALVGGAAGIPLGHFGIAGGAVAGAATEAAVQMAYRKALNAVATRPALASRLTYAVHHNVLPSIAGPLLAAMMIHPQTPPPPPPGQGDPQ